MAIPGYIVLEHPVLIKSKVYQPGETLQRAEVSALEYSVYYENLQAIDLEVLGHD